MSRIKNTNGTLNAYNISGYEVQPNDRFGYKICAKVWNENSWCAFRGLTDWTDEEVVSRGEEVSYEVAKWMFSTIANTIPNYGNW